MKLDFWAKVGFAIILVGLILNIWLDGANFIIYIGLIVSFGCFIDIDKKRKKLEHIEYVINYDNELKMLSNLFLQSCQELFKTSFDKYTEVLFNIKTIKINDYQLAKLNRIENNYIKSILALSEEYNDFAKMYKDITCKNIQPPEESKTKYLASIKEIVSIFKNLSYCMREQAYKFYFCEKT